MATAVRVSAMTARAQTVSPPTVAPYVYDPGTVSRSSYPYIHPLPSGVYEVRNALVDKQQRVGAYSLPKTITIGSGAKFLGGSWNQPVKYNEVGVVWKIKLVSSTSELWPGWAIGDEKFLAELTETNASYVLCPYPWSSTKPKLTQLNFMTYPDPGVWARYLTADPASDHTYVAPAPIVVASNVPCSNGEVCYTFETENGETAASPTAAVTLPALPDGYLPADVQTFKIIIREPLPMGALGYRLYWRSGDDGNFIRMPAPHCLDTANPSNADDWRFQPDDVNLPIYRYSASGPALNPHLTPQSNLSKLQVAHLDNPGKSVIVDEDIILTCPMIYMRGSAPSDASNIDTVICGDSGAFFHVTQSGTGYWPLWMNYSLNTKVAGAKMTSYGSCCLAFGDFAGGCSFANVFQECSFIANPRSDYTSHSMRIRWECAGWGGHSASETYFQDCKFVGPNPVWIEHNQSANIVFVRTHVWSAWLADDRRLCALWIETGNQVKFNIGTFLDCYQNVVLSLSGANLIMENIWSDQGCVSFIDMHSLYSNVKITGGKMNVRTHGTGEDPNLIRSFNCQSNQVTCVFTDIITQFDGDTPGRYDCYSYRPNRLNLLFSGGNLIDTTVLREMTDAEYEALITEQQGGVPEWLAAWFTFHSIDPITFNIPIPSSAITLPAQQIVQTTTRRTLNRSVNDVSVVVNIPAASTTSTATEVNVNSLTGENYVTRVGYKS